MSPSKVTLRVSSLSKDAKTSLSTEVTPQFCCILSWKGYFNWLHIDLFSEPLGIANLCRRMCLVLIASCDWHQRTLCKSLKKNIEFDGTLVFHAIKLRGDIEIFLNGPRHFMMQTSNILPVFLRRGKTGIKMNLFEKTGHLMRCIKWFIHVIVTKCNIWIRHL